ncbi:MAG: hypothetical protein JSS00_04715 [Proteobacteria bacterium]|nr:hypothetical protein [Pseudomonadota bacterium]
MKALAPKHKGGEVEEFQAAGQAVLLLERELSAVKGEQYAVPLAFPVTWDIGAPLPHLLKSDYQCFVIFYVAASDPQWDGRTAKVVDPANAAPVPLALVEFERCMSAKMGSPNDEVFHGHPLYKKGQEAYTAQEVVNSKWLAELEAINSVHSGYSPALWRDLHHYVFWFHDSTFECIAKSFEVELSNVSFGALLDRAIRKFLD